MRVAEKQAGINAYRMGKALILARSKTQHGQWAAFLKKFGISETTFTRAKKLAESATESELAGLGIVQAFIQFGVMRKPARKSQQDDDNAAANNTEKKPAVKKPTRLPKPPPPDNPPVQDKQGRTEKNEEDTWDVFNRYVGHRNEQHKVQLMVDFFGQNTLPHLIAAVQDVAAFKDFLAQQAPPKENPGPFSVLIQILHRMHFLISDLKAANWKKESAKDYHHTLDNIVKAVEQLRKDIPNET